MQKPILPVAGDQASIHGVNRVLSPKKLWMFFVCQQKFSEKHNLFFDRLKRLLVVQILEVTVHQENAEHVRLITFHWPSEKVKLGGTCLGEQKSIQQKFVFNSCKLCYYTEDTFTKNCLQRFCDIQRNEKVLLQTQCPKVHKILIWQQSPSKNRAPFMFPNFRSPRNLAPPLRTDLV